MRSGSILNKKSSASLKKPERLKTTWVNPNNFSTELATPLLGKAIEREYSLADLMRRPEVNYNSLMKVDNQRFAPATALSDDPINAQIIAEQVEISIKYAGYIGGKRHPQTIQPRNHAHSRWHGL